MKGIREIINFEAVIKYTNESVRNYVSGHKYCRVSVSTQFCLNTYTNLTYWAPFAIFRCVNVAKSFSEKLF